MRNITRLSLVLALTFSATSLANAADLRSTITGGYAQSTVWFDGNTLKDNPAGFNVKYRLELNEELGIITSYTKVNYDESSSYGAGSANLALDYHSFMIGPSFRANDYFSAYLMIGGAKGEAKGTVTGLGSETLSQTNVSVGAGFQFNIAKNFTIDTSYEYTKLDDVEVGTWVVGAGLSF